MSISEQEIDIEALQPGDPHYRAFVGRIHTYDILAAQQFNLMTTLGLRDSHYLLDIGCGSLKAGRLFIPYLQSGRYFGIEPEAWLIDEGIEKEIGRDIIRVKQPTFSNDTNFTLTAFNQQFDYMIAQSIFTHATQAQIRRCLSEAKKVLKPNGVFAANFFVGKKNYTGDEWVYPGITEFTLAGMQRMVEDNDLAMRLINVINPNPDLNHVYQWIAIVHPENSRQFPNMRPSGGLKGWLDALLGR